MRSRGVVLIFSSAILILWPVRAYAAAVDTVDSLFCEENSILYSCSNDCSNNPPSNANYTSSGEGGGCGENVNGSKSNEDQAWGYFVNQFISSGYSQDEAERATAGIMGNWMQESAFNSYRSDGSGCSGAAGPITGSAGMGIAQWCGDRQQKLADYAKDRGKDWTCLGTQLEYTWKEMQDRGLPGKMKGLSPAEASTMFDKLFEGSDGSGSRSAKGEQVYADYTGNGVSKGTGTVPATPASSKSNIGAANSCPKKNSYSGAVPGASCAEAQPAINGAIASGRITLDKPDTQLDIDHCVDGPIEYCTNAVQGKTLRGLVAASQSPGTDSIKLWNISKEHGCDGGDHPNGLASDIAQVNGQDCNTSSEACDALFRYLIDHQQELDIRWLIYDGPGCQAAVAGHSNISECRDDHNNHIHVSFNK